MEKISLKVQNREKAGKGIARSLRRDGNVPGVVYRDGKTSSISVNSKEMVHFIKKSAGGQVIVSLDFQDNRNIPALLKDYQADPVNNELLHVDFYEVSLTEKITVTIQVSTIGVPIGVKRDKGFIQFNLRAVEIECLPDNLPESINVNVEDIEIGKSLHVKDIEPPEGVTILTAPSAVVLSVLEPVIEVEEKEEEAEEVEGEAPEAPEGEVDVKGKEAEEGEQKEDK
jgi:large subunit ribosomal protein L25